MNSIRDVVERIKIKFADREFDKFIHAIHFPNFKNFSPEAKIEFLFPVTVLVGPNGGGKSSVLHAAWGLPLGFSITRFWFSTPLDPINYDVLEQHRVWYTHYIKSIDTLAQSRKISSKTRLNYWEPTRPAQKEGMQAMPKHTSEMTDYVSPKKDRWTPVDRTPYYFNAKAETSAIDRFFKSHTSATTHESRQEIFIKYSGKLKEVIEGDLASLKYYGVERVSENFMLSAKQLNAINKILNKGYKSARYINHKLYDRETFSPSVIFETPKRNYSECFAGSGELAVVNFVLAVDRLKKFDLLLLDEPETSLHPGAQQNLLNYLLEVVEEKMLQVIISTHSPTFVDLLPASALVILDENEHGVSPRVNPNKASAFARLGQASKNNITIFTEDRLLKALVERILGRIGKDLAKQVNVVASELGSSEMLSNQVRAHMQSGAKVLMLLDGDQKPVEQIFLRDPDTVSRADEKAIAASLKGLHVSIIGSKKDLAGWMNWCKNNVMILDRVCAEHAYLELINPQHKLLSKATATNQEFKSALRRELQANKDDSSADAQYYVFKSSLKNVVAGSALDVEMNRLAGIIEKKLLAFDE